MDALFLTSQRLISEHWPTVARVIAPVMGAVRGEFTVDDLQELCREGRAVAGLGFHEGEPVMAWVFEFRFYPRKTTVNIVALAGCGVDDAASTFWPRFVQWAKESGADEIEASTSRAMARLLAPLGFTRTYETVGLAC